MFSWWLVSIACAATAAAQPQADVAGTYKAGTATTKVDVSTWGEDCGPRPQDASDKSHPSVTVKLQGAQLALAFPDRKLRTDGCWSPNPAVRVASSTASAGRWRAECQTPTSDAKRERGVYTLTASAAGVLDLLEESSYDWQLNASRCVAKIRITQRLARGAALSSLNEPAPVPAAPAVANVCSPGPLTRLRLRPSELRIGPGERSCFSVRGVDAAGCAVHELGALKWDLTKPAGATASLSGACFKAADNAAEAEGHFRVAVSAGGVHDEVSVTVASADLSDITARRGASGNAGEVEVDNRGGGSASSFGIEAAVKRSSIGVKVAFGALFAGLLLGVAWLLSARSRKAAVTELGLDDTHAATTASERPARPLTPGAPTSGASEQLICPQCRHGYPAGTTHCPRDGAVPIPYAEFVRKAQSSDAGPRTCTSCGAQLVAGALFCGDCGAKVRS